MKYQEIKWRYNLSLIQKTSSTVRYGQYLFSDWKTGSLDQAGAYISVFYIVQLAIICTHCHWELSPNFAFRLSEFERTI